jgi:predicted O-methyltransferase YrrM
MGGLLLVDNAFAFGQLLDEVPADRDVPVIRALNDRLARDARFQSIIVPLGDGVWVGAKRA